MHDQFVRKWIYTLPPEYFQHVRNHVKHFRLFLDQLKHSNDLQVRRFYLRMNEILLPAQIAGKQKWDFNNRGAFSTDYIGKSWVTALGTAVPFGMNARQQNAWLYEGGGLKLLQDFYAKSYNVIQFPAGNTGAQMGGWFRKPITSVADMKGLKFRIGGFGGKVLERLGTVPQNIPGGEIYQALEKGTIDAAEWVGPYDDQKLGFNKVAPFYYYPGWWEGGPQLDFFINQKAYDALSAENKAIVEAAASVAHVEMQARYDAKNPVALKQLVGAGTKLRPFSNDVMAEAFKQSLGLYEELNSKNEDWKKIYADYSKFRADQNLWFRFTEATFDRFMQSQKL